MGKILNGERESFVCRFSRLVLAIALCTGLCCFFSAGAVHAAGSPSDRAASGLSAKDQDVPLTPQHGIPLVIVYVNETKADIEQAKAADPNHEYGNIAEMNKSVRHTVRAIGQVEIRVPDGYAGEYGSASVPAGRQDLGYIRGRGNSTWGMSKKPYKIHFKEAKNLFAMGQSKDWALMANAMDSINMRNRFTSWLGTQIGMPYTPQMVPVDLVMVGLQKDQDGNEQEVSSDYLGTYCLSETVEIGQDRVNITKPKKNDTDESAISGGYLLAVYCELQDEEKVAAASHFKTPSGMELTNDDPDFADESLTEGRLAQRDYIRGYINKLDNLIMKSEEITPEIHDQIADMLDLKSLADYWWVQEFSYNTDAYETGSTYLYKMKNGKLCWGPLWDFDLAWSVNIDNEKGYVKGFNNTNPAWAFRLREKDPEFASLLKERWNDENGIRNALLKITENTDQGILNKYRKEIAASKAADEERWPETKEEHGDFDENVEAMRSWINRRIEWIDANLDQLGDMYVTLTYLTEDGKVYKTEQARRGEYYLGDGPSGPEKEGSVFMGWKEKETGTAHNEAGCMNDVTFIPIYKKESDVKAPKQVFFQSNEVWIPYISEPGEASYYPGGELIVLPDDAVIGKITWTSSDENIVVFDDNEYVVTKGTGDVDITARLRNGLKKTMRLHVYDPRQPGMEPVFPESVSTSQASYTIQKGETVQIPLTFLPQGRPLELLDYTFEVDDGSVVTVYSPAGNIFTGLKAGKATIKTTVFDTSCSKEVTTSFQVIVKDDKGANGKISISNAKVGLSSKIFTYNRKVRRPVIRTIGGRILTPGKDYTLRWSKASSKSIGKYSVTVTGRGNYTGKTKASYKIVPRGTKIRKLKKGRKAVKVIWKRQSKKMPSSRITGYQVQIARDSKFTKNKKSFKIKGFKPISKKISGLKKGRKYYIRIRTYLKKKGKTYASKWSPVKKVKLR